MTSSCTSPLPTATTTAPPPSSSPPHFLPASEPSPTSAFASTPTSVTMTATAAMAAPNLARPSQTLLSAATGRSPFGLSIPSSDTFNSHDDISPNATASALPVKPSTVLIRHLRKGTTVDQVRLMLLWSDEIGQVEVLPETQEDQFTSAKVQFRTADGAIEAKSMLDGKQNMIVEIVELGSAPSIAERGTSVSSSESSNASSTNASRQPSRFNGAFAMGGAFGSNKELPNPEDSARYQQLFSPQSPIRNHISELPRISGKSLINHDTTDDDETGELLKDPLAYAEASSITAQRRATAPHLPITSSLAGLSLNTSAATGPSSLPHYGHQSALPSHHAAMSPTGAMNGHGHGAHGMHYPVPSPHAYGRHSNYPPINPADQNPPCNTLYVGNLPIDTSEEELKAMFSKQRGYKRLCFRTKQNGPMCFVEFEDVTFATKALNELYGQPLHNSVKGGIRLSFSKNPLGVRSGQNTGQAVAHSMVSMSMMAGTPNTFTTTNGPPPGLAAPPGLGSGRYGGHGGQGGHGNGNGQSYTPAGFPAAGGPNNPWNAPHSGLMASGGAGSIMNGNGSNGFMPPHMLGR